MPCMYFLPAVRTSLSECLSRDVNIPVDSKDIDDVYDDAWAVLKSKPPKQKDTVDVQTRVEDSYRNIRTK